ncbi:MAG: hypothetical protein INQ03_24830 [Candidatus Heimdallarchaeota archaeon]|nr:hypothetical protein [Candidatus Heimdallarchaeota archaeon]
MNILQVDEIREKLQGSREDKREAARHVWSMWGQFSEEDRIELATHGETLYELLKEEEGGRNAWNYILALGTIDYNEAQDYIFELLLHSEDENIRGYSAGAFYRYSFIQPHIIEKLWELGENDGSLVVRINCIRAAASEYYFSENESIARKLYKLLDTQKNNTVRMNIFQVIGHIGSKAILPELVHIMITGGKSDQNAAVIALDYLAEIHGITRAELIKSIELD